MKNTKTYKVIMLPTGKINCNAFIYQGDETKLLSFEKPTGECHWLHTPHHLYVIENSNLIKGDWCLFYNQPSEILEINGMSVKIKTTAPVSKEYAESINEIKGKVVINQGELSTMIHSFNMEQLPKIIAS